MGGEGEVRDQPHTFFCLADTYTSGDPILFLLGGGVDGGLPHAYLLVQWISGMHSKVGGLLLKVCMFGNHNKNLTVQWWRLFFLTLLELTISKVHCTTWVTTTVCMCLLWINPKEHPAYVFPNN